ncbi:putative transmembrane protein [Toxoplasma gondii FOU]|uniref:Putative transmembrane protein n=1 Tax=Toxoplasma gondii FOU TaxID=943167 RepID=A0A086LEV4_TOXGO|nr:putative transmembrane protein [Toxoplasma gondii FOU]
MWRSALFSPAVACLLVFAPVSVLSRGGRRRRPQHTRGSHCMRVSVASGGKDDARDPLLGAPAKRKRHLPPVEHRRRISKKLQRGKRRERGVAGDPTGETVEEGRATSRGGGTRERSVEGSGGSGRDPGRREERATPKERKRKERRKPETGRERR